MIQPDKTTLRPWLSWFVFCIALSNLSFTAQLCANDQLLRDLNQSLQAQDLPKAVKLGDQLFEEENPALDITLPLARLARVLQREGETKSAERFYRYSVQASERNQAADLPSHTKKMLRIAFALVLMEERSFAEACDQLEPIAEQFKLSDQGASTPQDSSLETTHKILNQIGSASLESKDLAMAKRAYTLATKIPIQDQATSKLGRAWAIALDGKNPSLAATELEQFVAQHPVHTDASQAAMLGIECYQRAGDSDGVLRLAEQLLKSWPDSKASRKLVNEFTDTPTDQIPDTVKEWILNQCNPSNIGLLGEKLLAVGLVAASHRGNDEQWLLIANHLGFSDQQGSATEKALDELTLMDRNDFAERLASILITPPSHIAETATPMVTAGAREAGCRWAGREAKWSLLAFATESESIPNPHSSRTADVERLLAESLVQVGRVHDAADWWNYLVDIRKASDFSTLLRCAEAETSTGIDSDQALKRINAAKAATNDDSFQIALVTLLEAELFIRKTNFDLSRDKLEQVAANESIDANLRARAQWLIGETYYLQESYTLAIKSYRKVESIAPDEQWIAASLVQAGKSFEQLGYRREAMICYSNLVTRFADTSYAKVANQRIATLDTDRLTPATDSPQSMKR